jgi:DNA-directed RNA polymerase subunit RPC12/RpoP
MNDAYDAVCMMCGRTLGYVFQNRFFPQPGGAKLEREGPTFRCGYCRGSILLEANPTRVPPDRVTGVEQPAVAGVRPRRAYRRRAV